MSAGLRFPKPRPRLLEHREYAASVDRINRQESAKVKARSGGRCEVIERVLAIGGAVGHSYWTRDRCARYAAPGDHHLQGGNGRRNRGSSILAEHRLAVCTRCHRDITGHVLRPIGTPQARESAATVIYERIGAKS